MSTSVLEALEWWLHIMTPSPPVERCWCHYVGIAIKVLMGGDYREFNETCTISHTCSMGVQIWWPIEHLGVSWVFSCHLCTMGKLSQLACSKPSPLGDMVNLKWECVWGGEANSLQLICIFATLAKTDFSFTNSSHKHYYREPLSVCATSFANRLDAEFHAVFFTHKLLNHLWDPKQLETWLVWLGVIISGSGEP